MKVSNEFILSYIITNYSVSLDNSDWCVYDNLSGNHASFNTIDGCLRRVFPMYGTSKLFTDWYLSSRLVSDKRINRFLSQYRLVDTGGPMTWDVQNVTNGKSFNLNDLYKHLPTHFHNAGIMNKYSEWFEHQKYIETSILVGDRKNK